MRILFVSWRDLAHGNAGGSEVVVDRLARGLQARGHDVALLCGGPVGERPYEVVANGSTYSQYLTAGPRYLHRHRDADLVVDVVNGMPFFTPLWRRGPGLCLVHHVHGEQWGQYFPRPIARTGEVFERRVLPRLYRGTHFLSISESTKADLEALGVPGDHIHLMYNGLALEDVGTRARSDTPMFLALGRLAPNKRLDLLLEHWKAVRPATGGRLVIVGDGPEQGRLAQLVAGDDSVELAGKVTERRKAELLSEAWLLVHTARHEGWGLVIMEAAACGTPAVAYDVPGVRDAVIDGVTGVLARDDAEFVDQWQRLANDATARSSLGTVGCRRAREFTWEGSIDDFLKAADAATMEGRARGRSSWVQVAAPAGATELPPPRAVARSIPTKGLKRSAHLFKLFRREPVDPDTFYHYLAADTVRQLGPYLDLAGARVVDIGGGPGYTAEALKAEGAQCAVVEYAFDELLLHERRPDVAVQGDGQALPVASGSVQLAHSSNVLEHVPAPTDMLAEMARVLEPDRGIGYLTFTNWLSPWGGHETSPWHYLGGGRAVRRYEKRNGHAPKNEYGTSLFALSVTDVLRWFEARPDLDVLWVGPRYLPEWARVVVRVPGVREVITWNLVVVFRRKAGAIEEERV
ncbi:MAG: glycosyltransferase [Actinobacteria bacterium]|nr:glycosyltransferase [Actinomycetota bacterium]